MSVAVLKKSNLRNYQVIEEPGTYVVKVAHSIKPDYLYGEGSNARYIINLRVATTEGFEECLKLMGNYEIVEFKRVRNCFMSGALWENDLDDITRLPAKGEEVIAVFDYIDDRLLCTSLTLIPREKLPTFRLEDMCKSRQIFKELLNNE